MTDTEYQQMLSEIQMIENLLEDIAEGEEIPEDSRIHAHKGKTLTTILW